MEGGRHFLFLELRTELAWNQVKNDFFAEFKSKNNCRFFLFLGDSHLRNFAKIKKILEIKNLKIRNNWFLLPEKNKNFLPLN